MKRRTLDSDSDSDDRELEVLDAAPAAARPASRASSAGSEPDWVKSFEAPSLARDGPSPSSFSFTASEDGGGQSDAGGSQETPIGSEAEQKEAAAHFAAKKKAKKKTSSSLTIRLMMPKISAMKRGGVLLQIEDQKFEVTSDFGAIGRYKANKRSVEVDIKGNIYEGSVMPCSSILSVVVGESMSGGTREKEAKVTAIFDNYVQLSETRNLQQDRDEEGDGYDELSDGESDGEPAASQGSKRKKPEKASKKPAARKGKKGK